MKWVLTSPNSIKSDNRHSQIGVSNISSSLACLNTITTWWNPPRRQEWFWRRTQYTQKTRGESILLNPSVAYKDPHEFQVANLNNPAWTLGVSKNSTNLTNNIEIKKICAKQVSSFLDVIHGFSRSKGFKRALCYGGFLFKSAESTSNL